MSLYTPTAQEIDQAIETAVETARGLAPALWPQLIRARNILHAGDLLWHEGGWCCRSHTEGAAAHALDFVACSCAGWGERQVLIRGEAFCAHRLALLAYCDICLAHLCARRLGMTKDPAARQAARSAPNAALLLMRYDGGRKLAMVTASPRGLMHVPVCQMAKVDGQLGFASEHDLAAFGTWLAQAQALPASPASLLAEAGKPLCIHFSPARVAHLAALLV